MLASGNMLIKCTDNSDSAAFSLNIHTTALPSLSLPSAFRRQVNVHGTSESWLWIILPWRHVHPCARHLVVQGMCLPSMTANGKGSWKVRSWSDDLCTPYSHCRSPFSWDAICPEMSKAKLVSMFVKRQSPPQGDLLDGTACAQAELQKQKSSSPFAGAGQHVLGLLARL